jgi:hypothetical protein
MSFRLKSSLVAMAVALSAGVAGCSSGSQGGSSGSSTGSGSGGTGSGNDFNVVNGTFTAPGVAASISNGAIYLQIFSGSRPEIVLGAGSPKSLTVTSPAGMEGGLTAAIGVSGTPGTYTDSASGSSGTIDLTYDQGGSGGDQFTAEFPLPAAPGAEGSWSLTLTSVTPFVGMTPFGSPSDTSHQYFTLHGSLTATLVGAIGNGNGTLQVSF